MQSMNDPVPQGSWAMSIQNDAAWSAADCPPGWKQFSVCGSKFTLPEHYRVIKPIGQGAYGVVW